MRCENHYSENICKKEYEQFIKMIYDIDINELYHFTNIDFRTSFIANQIIHCSRYIHGALRAVKNHPTQYLIKFKINRIKGYICNNHKCKIDLYHEEYEVITYFSCIKFLQLKNIKINNKNVIMLIFCAEQ